MCLTMYHLHILATNKTMSTTKDRSYSLEPSKSAFSAHRYLEPLSLCVEHGSKYLAHPTAQQCSSDVDELDVLLHATITGNTETKTQKPAVTAISVNIEISLRPTVGADFSTMSPNYV